MVDDEPAVLELLLQTLERAGYEAVGLNNPLLALEEIKKRKFSVIISDQRMPELSGLELLAQAAANPAQRHAHSHHRRAGAGHGHRGDQQGRNFPVRRQALVARGISGDGQKRRSAPRIDLPQRAVCNRRRNP